MGRYLQAFKEEGRALIGKRQEALPPPAQLYYDDVRPPAQPYAGQAYGQPPATIDPAVLQALLQGAKAQGAYEALQTANDASADRIQALALAAINKENKPFEIRYRGSAYDKKERRFGEMKFVMWVLAVLAACIFIWWAKDQLASSDYGFAQSAHAPMNSPHRPAHYKRSEEWDDR